ncbi:MAG: spore maturation protein [Candidatus Delongbacteria bacterium]|nr:spore maturation protein [Candidatus Delongbacteria bacterium]
MLNKVWFWMVVGSIMVAIGLDVWDVGSNRYKNRVPFEASFIGSDSTLEQGMEKRNGVIRVSQSYYHSFYRTESEISTPSIELPAYTLAKPGTAEGSIYILKKHPLMPARWKSIAETQSKESQYMIGRITMNRLSDGQAEWSVKLSFQDIYFVKMRLVVDRLLEMADTAVMIAIGLIGIMAIWLGIMRVAQEAGLINLIARFVRPAVKLLFPELPPDHPAVGHIVMNISANVLGLGNAATPFGLKAMNELEKVNPHPGTATNPMITFLAINTAGLTMIPTQVIAIRAAMGSQNPTIIIMASFIAASMATLVGISCAKILERIPAFRDPTNPPMVPLTKLALYILPFFILLYGGLFLLHMLIGIEGIKTVFSLISVLAIPLIFAVFLIYGYLKKVKIYDMVIEGAKEGFDVAVRIIPYLVAMLVAIAVFRASGCMDLLSKVLRPLTNLIGMPSEVLPMALMRPLSGSGSIGIMTELISVHGPDSFIGLMASAFYGSSETTFYILALYYGVVNIKNIRHSLWTGLISEAAGILTAVFICHILFG